MPRERNFRASFLAMAAATVIGSSDGPLARLLKCAGASLRRRVARQHRRLPDLRGRAGVPDAARENSRARPRRLPGRRHRDGRERVRILPCRSQDRRPLLPRLPVVLEPGCVLPFCLELGVCQHDHRHGVRGDGVRADQVHLSQPHRAAARGDAHACDRLGDSDLRDAAGAARTQPGTARLRSCVHRLLPRSPRSSCMRARQ